MRNVHSSCYSIAMKQNRGDVARMHVISEYCQSHLHLQCIFSISNIQVRYQKRLSVS